MRKILLLLSLILYPTVVGAVTRYADNTLGGNCTSNNYSIANRNCSGSDGNAYTTIEAAAGGLGPGDIVNIRTSATIYTGSSIYNNSISTYAIPTGAPGNNIIIQKYLPDSGVVTLKGIAGQDTPIVRTMKYITFKGHLTGETKDFVINCGSRYAGDTSGMVGIRGIRFENIEVKECSSMAIQGLADSQFINLNVHDNGFSSSAHCLGGCHAVYTDTDDNGFYSNNIFDGGRYHHNAGFGIHCYQDCGNTIIRNLRVDHNAITNGGGIIMAWKFVTAPSQIYNVIIDNNGGGGLYMKSPSMVAYGLTVVNNDVVYAQDGLTIRNSLVLGGIVPDSRIPGCCTITQSNNLTSGNPDLIFSDWRNGDFRLCYGLSLPGPDCTNAPNPAIDTGTPCPGATCPGAPYDFDFAGTHRPQGNRWNIGAYENEGGSLQNINITANPSTVTSGQSSALTWTATGVSSCTGSSNPSHSEWNGARALTGTNFPVTNITANTIFTLNCDGVSASATVSVSVPPLAVVLTPSSNWVSSNGQVQLTWSTTGAVSCTASASPANSQWTGAKATSGNATILNLTNFTNDFTLTCLDKDTNSASQTASVYVPAQLTLMAAYSCDDTPNDSSGRGHHGTLVDVTYDAGGQYNGACSFNGTTAYISIPDNNDFDFTTGFTLDAWVKPTAPLAYSYIINKTNPGNGDGSYWLGISTDICGFSPNPFAGYTQNSASAWACHGVALAASPTWTHLAITYDALAGQANVRLYRNGVEVTQGQGGAILSVGTGIVRIGSGAAEAFFTGLIDNIRLWNGPLTAAQIVADMNTAILAVPPAAPIGLKVGGTGTLGLGGTGTIQSGN